MNSYLHLRQKALVDGYRCGNEQDVSKREVFIICAGSVHNGIYLLLHYGSTNPMIRMFILMLDTRNEEQTNDVRMYIEEYLF